MTGKKCGVKLEDMIVAQRDDSEVNQLRDQVESLKTNLSTTQQKLNLAETELKDAKIEIDRFSASLVNNILEERV